MYFCKLTNYYLKVKVGTSTLSVLELTEMLQEILKHVNSVPITKTDIYQEINKPRTNKGSYQSCIT